MALDHAFCGDNAFVPSWQSRFRHLAPALIMLLGRIRRLRAYQPISRGLEYKVCLSTYQGSGPIVQPVVH